MKLSAQEEYGLRCLLHLAQRGAEKSATIPEIAQAEGLSVPNVAKLMRVLRMGGLVNSVRGQSGGYTLSRPAGEILVIDSLHVLGDSFFGPTFCDRHSGRKTECAHMTDCSLRAMWTAVHQVVQAVMGKTTLADLLCGEAQMTNWVAESTLTALPILENLRVAAARKQ
jgi:Rrf2 family transcriptional regulator, iron-sulfur cluster assembly transcription factor